MAYGDPQYQINDLITRVKTLEGQVRATALGPTAQAIPNAPLTVATSTGQTVAGVGGTQDALSRVLTTTLQGAFSGVESIEDAVTSVTVIPFSSNPIVLRTTPIRPDPVIGEVYHITAAGAAHNVSGGDVTLEFVFQPRAGTNQSLGIFTIHDGEQRYWWVDVNATINVAGTTGSVLVASRISQSGNITTTTGVQVTDDLLLTRLVSPVNLINTQFTTFVQCSVTTATVTLTFGEYVLERLGARSG